jgi:hypothetical protein
LVAFILEPSTRRSASVDVEVSWRTSAEVWWNYLSAAPLSAYTQQHATLKGERLGLAPIAAFVSNCHAANPRFEYLQQLMAHIRVDSYGLCLNTANESATLLRLSPHAAALAGGPGGKAALMSHYHFVLAAENTILNDYVSEKFFEPLRVGAVPIYDGAPNIAEFAPVGSYIPMRQLSAEALAARITETVANASSYASHMRWKDAADGWPAFQRLWRHNFHTAPCNLCEYLCTTSAASSSHEL